jgi:hypothetical protein
VGANVGFRGRQYACCPGWRAGAPKEVNAQNSCCDFQWMLPEDKEMKKLFEESESPAEHLLPYAEAFPKVLTKTALAKAIYAAEKSTGKKKESATKQEKSMNKAAAYHIFSSR